MNTPSFLGHVSAGTSRRLELVHVESGAVLASRVSVGEAARFGKTRVAPGQADGGDVGGGVSRPVDPHGLREVADRRGVCWRRWDHPQDPACPEAGKGRGACAGRTRSSKAGRGSSRVRGSPSAIVSRFARHRRRGRPGTWRRGVRRSTRTETSRRAADRWLFWTPTPKLIRGTSALLRHRRHRRPRHPRSAAKERSPRRSSRHKPGRTSARLLPAASRSRNCSPARRPSSGSKPSRSRKGSARRCSRTRRPRDGECPRPTRSRSLPRGKSTCSPKARGMRRRHDSPGLLHALSEGAQGLPVQLRLLVLQELSPSPACATTLEFSTKLALYERPGRANLIRGVYERFQRLPPRDAESRPASQPAHAPAPQPEAWWRRRVVRGAAAAALAILLVFTATAWLWNAASPPPPGTVDRRGPVARAVSAAGYVGDGSGRGQRANRLALARPPSHRQADGGARRRRNRSACRCGGDRSGAAACRAQADARRARTRHEQGSGPAA